MGYRLRYMNISCSVRIKGVPLTHVGQVVQWYSSGTPCKRNRTMGETILFFTHEVGKVKLSNLGREQSLDV